MLSLEQCSQKKFLVFGLGISGDATLSQLKKIMLTLNAGMITKN